MSLLTHHTTAPNPQGPPIVLLHGFASDAQTDFADWADSCAESGRSTLTVELPAHGGNQALTSVDNAGTEAAVRSIVATIDEVLPPISTPRVDVVGYSLGARLAWELPRVSARVNRLVLGGLSPMEPFEGVTAEALRPGTDADPAEPTSANPIIRMLAGMISAPDLDTASLAALAEGLGREPFDPFAAPPQLPTLLVAGKEDPMSQGVESLLEALPGSTLVRIPGDHLGALHSEEFRTAALGFLAM